jgi:Skp family chaperone for outer membrane proteins
MGAIALSSRPWTRRKAIALAVLLPGLGLLVGRAAADEAAILTVSRKRLLNDTAHARALLKAEITLTAELQRRVDAIKAELTAEEQELTRLRPTLEREVFAARVAAFDRNVRNQRRASQQQAALLQSTFRAARLKLVEALGPLLEEVRQELGASVILNTDQVLTSDPALDVTDEVIARFNATVPLPVIPDLDVLAPAPPPASPPAQDGEPPPQ